MHVHKKILISAALSVAISYGMMYTCHLFLYLHSGALAIALIFGTQVYIILTLKERSPQF